MLFLFFFFFPPALIHVRAFSHRPVCAFFFSFSSVSVTKLDMQIVKKETQLHPSDLLSFSVFARVGLPGNESALHINWCREKKRGFAYVCACARLWKGYVRCTSDCLLGD